MVAAWRCGSAPAPARRAPSAEGPGPAPAPARHGRRRGRGGEAAAKRHEAGGRGDRAGHREPAAGERGWAAPPCPARGPRCVPRGSGLVPSAGTRLGAASRARRGRCWSTAPRVRAGGSGCGAGPTTQRGALPTRDCTGGWAGLSLPRGGAPGPGCVGSREGQGPRFPQQPLAGDLLLGGGCRIAKASPGSRPCAQVWGLPPSSGPASQLQPCTGLPVGTRCPVSVLACTGRVGG